MLNLIIAGLILPLVASLLLFRRPRRPPGGWIATFVLALGMTAFAFFAVPWGFLGMPLRYTMAAVFAASVAISLIRRPDDRAEDSPARMALKVLIGLFFGSVAVGVIRASAVPPSARDLAFPLTRGTYTVLHGGSTTAANTYFGRGAQGFAVDITAKRNEPVVSPCDGTIIATKPLRLRCGDMTVELTTAEATASGTVRRGAPVGRVTGDYLHVFAENRPVTFDGRWLVRNVVVRR